jgi:hypothetical protein
LTLQVLAAAFAVSMVTVAMPPATRVAAATIASRRRPKPLAMNFIAWIS